MKTKLLAIMILAGGSMFAAPRISIGVSFGGAPVRPAYEAAIPPCPGPDFVWVDGYWSENYGRNVWVPGYWNRRPVVVTAPRYDGYRDHEGYRDRDSYRNNDVYRNHDAFAGRDVHNLVQQRNSAADRPLNRDFGNHRDDGRDYGRRGR